MSEILRENVPASPAEKYPSLVGADLASKARNIGGDVMLIDLTPEQSDAVIQVCIDHQLPVPTKEETDLNFGSQRTDEVTRDRVLFLVGARSTKEILRDPDFRAEEGAIKAGVRNLLAMTGLRTPRPSQTAEQVATEMRKITTLVGREKYIDDWISELRVNGADGTTARSVIRGHLRVLEASGLLSPKEKADWDISKLR